MTTWVYRFDEVEHPDTTLLGGKGANLAQMTLGKLPVPPGFIITTAACHAFHANENALTGEMWGQITHEIHRLEMKTGKQFGGHENPLLVSVRSGAPVSMPGMMDTVLNLGLNDETVTALIKKTGNARFSYDCYRRFIQMFGDVVLDVPHYKFEQILRQVKQNAATVDDQGLAESHLREVITGYLELVKQETGHPFPQDPTLQLQKAIDAVFLSWNNQRAKVYRRIHRIPDTLGTAVTVQSMVFGNMGDDSGTGVAFTRNPSTGERRLFGEYLTNAQGEDVVAGIRTPRPIHELKSDLPEIYTQFTAVCEKLERYYRDVQDIEFTVEQGQLYLLQTRTAKRTASAAVKVVIDLVNEGLIDRRTAIMRVNPEQLNQLIHPSIDWSVDVEELAKGLPASPGTASGRITFEADDAEKLAQKGESVILVRTETTPDDIHGIIKARGILTSRGGMTSHAAVVARGMGKPCVCGCDELSIDEDDKTCFIGDTKLKEGDIISIDGATGRVILGEVAVLQPEFSEEFRLLLNWADETRELQVRANADNPEDARRAREFGAEGIGLCRTEHMFMAADRVPLVQAMILATSTEERDQALSKLLPMQEDDFYGILLAMDGLPVTVRLLDPPLHEFLPNAEELIERQAELRARLEYEPERADYEAELHEVHSLLAKVKVLREANPMLGHRGCRLGLTYPEVYEMQTRALFQAAARLLKEGMHPLPEVMIPLVGHAEELRRLRKSVEAMASVVEGEQGISIPYTVGTMIEVPRAALTADEIAEEAEFFSFGTNDLTQTTFGYSRDDAEGKFLTYYVDSKIIPDNPFIVLDTSGVGQLVSMAAEKGRRVKPDLKLGICGEHGGEQQSILFCHQNHLNYVSCSPFRVPLARLAASQAVLALTNTNVANDSTVSSGATLQSVRS